ncbi:MAG: hypothetical protein ACOC84_00740 [Actinomycetota bacterium]
MTAPAFAPAPDYRGRPADRLEDLDFLIRMGTPPRSILPRLDFPTAGAAERFARRHGRHDLAAVFADLAFAERRGRDRREGCPG